MPQPIEQRLIKNSFTSGELSPRMVGRTDLKGYFNGVATLENWLIYPQGGVYRRPGLRFVAQAKLAQDTHLFPFSFSNTQAYIIEAGNLYFRFYKNGAQILSGGNPVEVTTLYVQADIPKIKIAQSADTMYLAHSTYAPSKLTRTSDTAWTLSVIKPIDGPYLDENIVTTALVACNNSTNPATTAITGASASAGLINILDVAHGYATNDWVNIQQVLGTTEANGYWKITKVDADNYTLNSSVFTNAYVSGGKAYKLSTLTASGTNTDGSAFAPFVTGAAGHVTALWRVKASAVYGWLYLVSVNSTTVAVVDIKGALDGTGTTSLWREGAWSFVRGFPGAVTINSQRLIWAATTYEPQRVYASKSNNYETYTPATTDSDAWVYQIGSTTVDTIRWLSPVSRGLMIGTAGSEFLMRGALGGTAGDITPTSVDVHPHTTYGSNNAQPIRLSYLTYFAQRAGKKIRELSYQFAADTYVAPDKTVLSEHITGAAGIHVLSYQQEPNSLLFVLREDGVLACATVYPEQEVFGWSRIVTGGYAGDTAEPIDHVATIPAPDGLSDQTWVTVNRTINGSSLWYIAYFDPTVNTDAAQTLDNTNTLYTLTPGATTGNGVTFTASGASFTGANVGSYLMTLPDGNVAPANTYGKGRAKINIVSDTTHVICDITDDFPNTTAIPAKHWGIGVTSFTGLTKLANRQVQLIGDGAIYNPVPPGGVPTPTLTVDASGNLSIPAGMPPIVVAEIGIPFTATLVTMRPETGQGGNTIQMDKKRFGWVRMRCDTTTTIQVGDNNTGVLYEFPSRSPNNPLGVAPAPTTGDFDLRGSITGWNYDAQLKIQQPNPSPTSIHAIMGRLELGGDGE